MAAIYAPYVRDTAISFESEPPDAAAMAARIAATTALHPWLVAEADGTVLGYCYATRHRERAAYRWGTDVSVYLAADARGRGLGRLLYTALLDLLRRQGFRTAYAGIALPNPASVRLHEAMGFQPIGVYPRVGYKLGRWHDVGWWELPLHPTDDSPPAEPIPFPELDLSAAAMDRDDLGLAG